MNQFNELLLAVFLLSCLMLAISSRLLHCIRYAALQGIVLGILPLTLAQGHFEGSLVMALVNLLVKGIGLPLLICRAPPPTRRSNSGLKRTASTVRASSRPSKSASATEWVSLSPT